MSVTRKYTHSAVTRKKRKLECRKELNKEKREGKKREARGRVIKSGKKD